MIIKEPICGIKRTPKYEVASLIFGYGARAHLLSTKRFRKKGKLRICIIIYDKRSNTRKVQ